MFLIESILLEAPDDEKKKDQPTETPEPLPEEDNEEETPVDDEEDNTEEEVPDTEDDEDNNLDNEEEVPDSTETPEEPAVDNTPATNLYTSNLLEVHKAFLELRDMIGAASDLLSKVSNSAASREVKQVISEIYSDINAVKERIDIVLDRKFEDNQKDLLNNLYSSFNEYVKNIIERIDAVKISNEK